MYQRHDFEIFPISGLEKVRGGSRPQLFEEENTALVGERFSFQIAYRSISRTLIDLAYCLEGIPQSKAKVYAVREMPCSYPKAENSDDYLLTDVPCLMPDALMPVPACGVVAKSDFWQSFYIVLENLTAGAHTIVFTIRDRDGVRLGQAEYTLRVLKEKLPQTDMVNTFWIHYDCIADLYRLPVFSRKYNRILKSYIKNAVKYGLTMLLTPLFTPPLDTEVGKERMTVQLIDVKKQGERYEFGFERLGNFLRLAESSGVKYFEMSHLFTQWGAGYAPKIIATEDGVLKCIFGWKTKALSREYMAFLSAFLPQLREWLIEGGYYRRCYFHVSDEPDSAAFPHYKECVAFLRKYLPDAKFTDALSHYEYYEEKVVDHPFVALDATEEFIQKGADGYFVYYCTSQRSNFVSNHFLSMPLERTRVLGLQLYLNGVSGFLHWGYNFYYSFLSRVPIDPFSVTDCMGKYQSGDAFLVYPGKDGAIGSMRAEAFYQGLQDMRALKALEDKIGRENVCAFLERNGVARNFSDYPKNTAWLICLRKKINQMIEK